MTPLLFALALFSAQQAADHLTTAGQLYDGCVRYLAQGSTSNENGLVGEVTCAAEVAMVAATEAAEAAMAGAGEVSSTRRYCIPEVILSAEDDHGAPIVQAFIAYVDHNPASREMDYDEVFARALAEKWPCPH